MNELRWMMVLSLALCGAATWAQAGSNAPPGSARVTTTPAPLPLPMPVAPASSPAVQRPRAPTVAAPVSPAAPQVEASTPASPAAPARSATVEAAPVAPALAAHGLPATRQGIEAAVSPAKPAASKSVGTKSAHAGRHAKPAEEKATEDRRLVREPRLRPDPPAPKLATAAQGAEPNKGQGRQRTAKASARQAHDAKAAPVARATQSTQPGRSMKASPTNKGPQGAKVAKPGKAAEAHRDAHRAKGAGTKALPHHRRNDGSQP